MNFVVFMALLFITFFHILVVPFTRTSIIQHLYHEIMKTAMKMILVAVTTIFWVSVMNKLYYVC